MTDRKFIIIIFLFLFPFWIVQGQKVELSGINELAGRFIDEYFPEDNYQISKVVPHYLDGEAVVYYMQLYPEGWILLSAERKTAPVLGFSYEGTLNYRSVFSGSEPAGEWLKDISERIVEYGEDLTLKPHPDWKNKFVSTKGTTINPLITTKWGQGTGWNYYCPEDTEGPDGRALVGCVAVAMAQALSVSESPASGVGENSYQHFVYGDISVNYSDSSYKWSLMNDVSPNRHSALLLYHCAVSVNMNFGSESSSANTSSAAGAFIDHFRISDNTENVKRWNYGLTAWEELILGELEAGRPVVYRGRSPDGSSGHAFNVDGVVNDRYFHVNWGWGGSSDGNFLLHELKPTSTRDYSANQEAIIGIEPAQSTGISFSRAPEFSLYPNPAADILFIKRKENDPVRSCIVYSPAGLPILVEEDYNEEYLDISSLRPGYYILTIFYTDNRRESSRFIKYKK